MIPKSTLFDDDSSQMDVASMGLTLDDATGQSGDVFHPVGDHDAAVSMVVIVENKCSAAGSMTLGAPASVGMAEATEDECNATGGTTVGSLTSKWARTFLRFITTHLLTCLTELATNFFSRQMSSQQGRLFYVPVKAALLPRRMYPRAENQTAIPRGEQQHILQWQYEDLHHMALKGVMQDFQAQKDALGEMETVLQKRDIELASLCTKLETHAKECATHQEQLCNEQQLAMQWNHSQLEEFQRQLELKLQSQMEKMLTTRAANLETCVQEEVTRLRESLQVEKEREMVKLKQEVMRLRESLQAEKEREMDEEVRLEKESEPTVHQDFILAEVRRLFKEKLGITQDLDFIMHCPAAAEDVFVYEYEDGPGPDQNNLTFDLTQNYSSPWNTHILELLCQELQARREEENWPIKRSDNYIMDILQERYKQLWTVWRNAQPKLTSKGVLETPAETEAHLVEGRMQMGKESRQANHCQNISLVMVLDKMVKLKSEVQDDDLQSWKWLQGLIKMLGEHCMSSEESSVENRVENVLHVKNMPWHRNIDQELEIVDFQCVLDTDIFSPQGSKPLTHKHSPDNPLTTRNVVKALPLALYDGAWFVQLTKRQIEALNVCQQTFPWMKVIVA
ncbi:hypothetical protein EDD17DRAFT_1760860 [Pisolithus thermaeus]|nr:hypothetical protein EDD17DRAFT_1760860 [Pisolithus thermaeus]